MRQLYINLFKKIKRHKFFFFLVLLWEIQVGSCDIEQAE